LIPYGKTISYSDLARKAGKPLAIRAAGTNTGRNPLSIIIPCHRVVVKTGDVTKYAGGSDRKRYLLELENSSGKTPGKAKK
jgi:methylated-DNA-[protein]-cysteine S-methyltransferase